MTDQEKQKFISRCKLKGIKFVADWGDKKIYRGVGIPCPHFVLEDKGILRFATNEEFKEILYFLYADKNDDE